MNNIMIREIPKCECHNLEMGWHKDNRKKKGGWWYCRIASRKDRKNYCLRHPERYKEQLRRRYDNPIYKARKIQELRNWEEEKQEDILWRLKQDTKKWQRKFKSATYL